MVLLCFFVHQCFGSLSPTVGFLLLSIHSLAPEFIDNRDCPAVLSANQILDWKKLAPMDQLSKGLIRLQEQGHTVPTWLLRDDLCSSGESGR